MAALSTKSLLTVSLFVLAAALVPKETYNEKGMLDTFPARNSDTASFNNVHINIEIAAVGGTLLAAAIALIACCIKVGKKNKPAPEHPPAPVHVTTPVTVNNTHTTHVCNLKSSHSVCISNPCKSKRPVQEQLENGATGEPAGDIAGEPTGDIAGEPAGETAGEAERTPLHKVQPEELNKMEVLEINEGVAVENYIQAVGVEEVGHKEEVKVDIQDQLGSTDIAVSTSREEEPMMEEAKETQTSNDEHFTSFTFVDPMLGFYG